MNNNKACDLNAIKRHTPTQIIPPIAPRSIGGGQVPVRMQAPRKATDKPQEVC
jgi:hypothetical protein